MYPCRAQAAARQPPKTRGVLTIGPPSSLVGGMAAVVGQMRRLDLGPRYATAFFDTTHATDARENRLGKLRRHVRRLRQLRQTLAEAAPAIAHLHTCSGFSFHRSGLDLWTVRRAGCRTALHVHGGFFDDFYAAAPGPQKRLIRRTLAAADRVIALSPTWQSRLAAIAPRARIVVIENAVEVPAQPPARVADNTCRFLMLGTMDTSKGIDDLLTACVELRSYTPQAEMVLAGPPGTAGDEPALNARIAQLGLEPIVRYVGPVSGQGKIDLLRAADVFVLASHREGMPLAILEALAYGLPVIATPVGAIGEVITQARQGLLVAPGEPRQLAAAMSLLAQDAPARIAMGQTAYELARDRFSVARLQADLIRLYDDMLGISDARSQNEQSIISNY